MATEAALEEGDALTSVAAAYRSYAKEHPHLYRLMTEHPLERDRLEPGAEDSARIPARLVVGDDADAARALWGFAHGMTILELDGRFPEGADLDPAWERGLQAFRRSLGVAGPPGSGGYGGVKSRMPSDV